MYLMQSRLLHWSFLLLLGALFGFGMGSRSGPAAFAAGLPGTEVNALYIYRRGTLAAYAQPFRVLVDGKPAGTIANASYLRLSLPPGSHQLQIAPGGRAQVTTLRVEGHAGGRRFYEFVFPTGWDMRPSFKGAAIVERAESLALEDMKGMRPMVAPEGG